MTLIVLPAFFIANKVKVWYNIPYEVSVMNVFLSKLFMSVIYMFQILAVIWAYDKILEPRFTKKLAHIIVLAVYTLVISIHLTITHFSPDMGTVGYVIYDIMRFLITAAGLAAAYKGKPAKMLITFMVVFYGCSTLASAMTAVFIPYGENAQLLQDYPILAMVMCIFLWMLMPIAVFVINRFSAGNMPKHFLLYMIFPAAQFVSSTIISDMLVFVPEDRHELKVISFFVNVVGIAADVFLLLIITRMTEHEEIKKKLETEVYIKRSEESYYKHINEKLATTMKIRHDLKNVLIAAEKLISEDETRADGKKLIELLKTSSIESEPKYYCEHKVINAVLFDKSEKAKENGISINVNADVPDDIAVDCYDLCRVFSNVLDNASESAACAEEKRIDFSCRINKGYLYIESQNSFRPENIKKGLLTIKKDRFNHGYGTSIIKEIAERYEGNVKFSSEGEMFFCRVWLKA